MRLVTADDTVRINCPEIDMLEYCVILSRGMNVSCHECTRWRKGGALWERFLRQDKRVNSKVK